MRDTETRFCCLLTRAQCDGCCVAHAYVAVPIVLLVLHITYAWPGVALIDLKLNVVGNGCPLMVKQVQPGMLQLLVTDCCILPC